MVGHGRAVGSKEAVARGYDRVGGRYGELALKADFDERARYVDALIDGLPSGARLLDLGCGAGVPTTRRLAEHFEVTGVDISQRQVERARYNVPGATFLWADMSSLDLPAASFDAVTAFYSIIHVPRDEQPELLRSIATWLRPCGPLAATLGAESVEAAYDDFWPGVSMFWSSFDSATGCRMIEDAGLGIASACERTSESPGGGSETFLWVVARKPG